MGCLGLGDGGPVNVRCSVTGAANVTALRVTLIPADMLKMLESTLCVTFPRLGT